MNPLIYQIEYLKVSPWLARNSQQFYIAHWSTTFITYDEVTMMISLEFKIKPSTLKIHGSMS